MSVHVALYSPFKIMVLCALFQAAAAESPSSKVLKDGTRVLLPQRPRPPSNVSLARVARGRKLQGTPARESCGRCCYTVTNDIAGTSLDASFYAKRVDLRGFTLASSATVSDDALLEAALTVDRMVSKRPDLLQTLINEGVHLTVLGKDELTTDVPEYAYLATDTGYNWDRARGIGATAFAPVTSCAEENLLCYSAQDTYDGENICVHELAHSLQGSGCKLPTRRYHAQGSGLNAAIDAAYEAAQANGRWTNTYAISTHEEFWAEGVQAFYNVDQSGPVGGDGIHNHVDTRAELEAYEPDLASLIAQTFDGAQSFPCPTASCDCSTFVCPVVQAPPAWRCDAPVDTLEPYTCTTAGRQTASCCGPAPLPPACHPSPNVCANPATFNSTATATIGGSSLTCDYVNTVWAAQRGSAASDAAACDAVSSSNVVRSIAWAAAAACCGGADDSVCGAPRTTCDSLAACDGENPGTVGASAACYAAVVGVIALSGNDAAWLTVCTDVSPAEVPTACQEKICSDLAACPGSKACASSDDCPAGCVSVNARQRRQLLFGSIPITAECPKGCVAAYSSL